MARFSHWCSIEFVFLVRDLKHIWKYSIECVKKQSNLHFVDVFSESEQMLHHCGTVPVSGALHQRWLTPESSDFTEKDD